MSWWNRYRDGRWIEPEPEPAPEPEPVPEPEPARRAYVDPVFPTSATRPATPSAYSPLHPIYSASGFGGSMMALASSAPRLSYGATGGIAPPAADEAYMRGFFAGVEEAKRRWRHGGGGGGTWAG